MVIFVVWVVGVVDDNVVGGVDAVALVVEGGLVVVG